MPSRKRIPEETKAVIKVLKTTTDLTLEKIAKQCKVSIASIHREGARGLIFFAAPNEADRNSSCH